jgi:hypothetical protein
LFKELEEISRKSESREKRMPTQEHAAELITTVDSYGLIIPQVF